MVAKSTRDEHGDLHSFWMFPLQISSVFVTRRLPQDFELPLRTENTCFVYATCNEGFLQRDQAPVELSKHSSPNQTRPRKYCGVPPDAPEEGQANFVASLRHATGKNEIFEPTPTFLLRRLVWFAAISKNGLLSCYTFKHQKPNFFHTPFFNHSHRQNRLDPNK